MGVCAVNTSTAGSAQEGRNYSVSPSSGGGRISTWPMLSAVESTSGFSTAISCQSTLPVSPLAWNVAPAPTLSLSPQAPGRAAVGRGLGRARREGNESRKFPQNGGGGGEFCTSCKAFADWDPVRGKIASGR